MKKIQYWILLTIIIIADIIGLILGGCVLVIIWLIGLIEKIINKLRQWHRQTSSGM